MLVLLLVAYLGSSVSLAQTERIENPTTTLPCGLPAYCFVNDRSTVKSWSLVSNCDLSDTPSGVYHFHITSLSETDTFTETSTYTIEGNGYTISGLENAAFLFMENKARLYLNNVTIRENGEFCVSGLCAAAVTITKHARVEGRNVIIQNSSHSGAIDIWGGNASFENLHVLNNHQTNTGWNALVNVSVFDPQNNNIGANLRIKNVRFCDNTGARRIFLLGSATLTLEGTVAVVNNTYVDDMDETQDMPLVAKTADATSNIEGATVVSSCTLPQRKTAKKKEVKATPIPAPTKIPVATCRKLLENNEEILIFATYGLNSGVQCQEIEGAGIGIKSVLELGVIRAIDVWGYVEQGVEVCFSQSGAIVFLDANTAPRAVEFRTAYFANGGMTCTWLDSHGSVVLLEA